MSKKKTPTSSETSESKTFNESKTFKNMLSEVESIIEEMNEKDLDLDEVVIKVEKGYSLIKSMRDRINQTKEKIEKLRSDFDEEEDDEDDEETPF